MARRFGYRRMNSRRKYAQGKKALAICDRTGFEHKMKDMVVEPGTNLLVYKYWSDGRYNIVDHPQNFPPDTAEAINLKNPRPDTRKDFMNFVVGDNDQLVLGEGQPIVL